MDFSNTNLWLHWLVIAIMIAIVLRVASFEEFATLTAVLIITDIIAEKFLGL